MSNRFLPALVALLLGACAGSPVTHHYTLVVPDLGAAVLTQGTPSPASGPLFEVLPVRVPAQVDVPELVLRQGSGELSLAETELWIAPLAVEIRDALSRELARRGGRDAHGLSLADTAAVQRIRLTVRRFDSEWSRRAVFEAVWAVGPQAGPTLSCETRIVEPVGAGYEALVRGHQKALAMLATQISSALAAGRCPS